MPATFGEVLNDNVTPLDGTSAAADSATESPIDINDPQLTSESLEYDPKANAFAAPPTLPDGKYRAKLKARDVGKAPNVARFLPKKDERSGKLYLYTALDANIIDHSGKYDNLPLTAYFIDTFLRMDRRSGKMTSRVVTILDRLGVKVAPGLTHGALMNEFLKALAGEPEIGLETEWEWGCMKCQEEAKTKGLRDPKSIKGMQRFPQTTVDGRKEYDPTLVCPVNPAHGPSRARPQIKEFLYLSELK